MVILNPRIRLFIPLVVGSIFIIFFSPLFNQRSISPTKTPVTFDHLRNHHHQWIHEDGGISMNGKEDMNLHLRRLLKGKDLAQLDASGISCLYEFHFLQCIINKQVIIQANQPLTAYVPSDQPSEKWTVQPYSRREDPTAMKEVTPVEIHYGNNITKRKNASSYCEVYHKVPAIIFSTGGFVGNLFHEFNEIIIPLFITSWHFKSQVQFVVTDYQDWWVLYKYKQVLKHLSSFEVLDGDSDGRVHCFPSAVFGLRYHDNLALDSSEIPGGYTMADFRDFLAKSYSLTMNGPLKPNKKPKILFIPRKETRVFLNEDEIVNMMLSLGLEIELSTAHEVLKLDQFAEVVNSCDIMMGAHGAGLTNEVFLRNGAVVIQIVPLALDWASDVYFGKPARDVGLKYIEYKAGPKESSLYEIYGPNNPIISDPLTVFEQGYRKSRSLYIEGQNITINIPRLKGVLMEALNFLGY